MWASMSAQMAEAGGFFAGMFHSFKTFVKRYLWSLIIFGLIGAGVGSSLHWMKPQYYQAEMTVSYVHYEKKIYADMLEKLNRLIQSGNTDILSGLLELDESDVRQVHYIKSYNIKNEALITDLSTEKLPFYISVGVEEAEILPSLEEAIVNYLDNTEYIQSRLDYMMKKSEEELEFLKHKLAVADSLSKMYIIRDEGINDEKAITRKELLDETLTIYTRIQEVRGLQNFNLNIEVLDGFIALPSKAEKSLLSCLIFGFMIGLGSRLVLLMFK